MLLQTESCKGGSQQGRAAQAAPLPCMSPGRWLSLKHRSSTDKESPHHLSPALPCMPPPCAPAPRDMHPPHPHKESKDPTCHPVGHQALQIQGFFSRPRQVFIALRSLQRHLVLCWDGGGRWGGGELLLRPHRAVARGAEWDSAHLCSGWGMAVAPGLWQWCQLVAVG